MLLLVLVSGQHENLSPSLFLSLNFGVPSLKIKKTQNPPLSSKPEIAITLFMVSDNEGQVTG